jgi:hypothetical protein
MAKKGFKSVTLRQDVYDLISKIAQKKEWSIPKVIGDAVQDYKKKEGLVD